MPEENTASDGLDALKETLYSEGNRIHAWPQLQLPQLFTGGSQALLVTHSRLLGTRFGRRVLWRVQLLMI